MARRGFFAEIQHQNKVAARDRERAEREGARRRDAAIRQSEQARKSLARAQVQFAKANEADRKRHEKELREAHLAAMEAEVIERNEKLEEIHEALDSLLSATLVIDDYVDLNSLRVNVSHPPFDRIDLQKPIPQPKNSPIPTAPILVLPSPPSGLMRFFGKKKYSAAIENAQIAHDQAMAQWRKACHDALASNESGKEKHSNDEIARLKLLASARSDYEEQCSAREVQAATDNKRLEEFVANLGYGVGEAIQEYISIVLSNSVYPDHFSVTHEFEFDPSTAELCLKVEVPGPSAVPEIKAYKYSKSADEITSTTLSQKECRERYSSAIHQVALRSLHEVFESDRRGLIKTISLEVGSNIIDPATGKPAYIPFVIAAAERESFLAFDLSAVIPALTLGKIGAIVSKNPYGLVPVDRFGVRKS